MAKILLIGNHRPSLALVRALHRHGHEIWVGSNGYSDYVEWSRCVTGAVPMPDFDPEVACIRRIREILVDLDIDVLVPITDRATRLVADHRDELINLVNIASPDAAVVKACVSKTQMAALCVEAEVPLARFVAVECLSDIREAIDTLGYPLVIKPTGEGEFIHGSKVITLFEDGDLERLFPAWPGGHASLLVQRRLDGHRFNQYFVASAGKVLTGCEIEILRTDRSDGSGYAVEGITREPRADLVRQTEALVKALNYTGAGCAQYMTSADGTQTSFLEINPRLGANFGGAEAAGAGMSERMLALALGETPVVEHEPWSLARPGIRYAWSKGAFSGLAWRARQGAGAAAIREGAVQLVSSALRAQTHLTFAWHDPLPALGCWLHPLIKRLPEARQTPRNATAAP